MRDANFNSGCEDSFQFAKFNECQVVKIVLQFLSYSEDRTAASVQSVAAAASRDNATRGQTLAPGTDRLAAAGARGKRAYNCERDMFRYSSKCAGLGNLLPYWVEAPCRAGKMESRQYQNGPCSCLTKSLTLCGIPMRRNFINDLELATLPGFQNTGCI